MKSETTQHGENIANQIDGEDAYGNSGQLTVADMHRIVDTMHTNVMLDDSGNDREFSDREHAILDMLSRWMREMEMLFDD